MSVYDLRCPFSRKYQLAEWASQRFGKSVSHFNKMKKAQLYAIWYNVSRCAHRTM